MHHVSQPHCPLSQSPYRFSVFNNLFALCCLSAPHFPFLLSLSLTLTPTPQSTAALHLYLVPGFNVAHPRIPPTTATTFGSVLDMVADRCTTLCLMMACANFYPAYLVPMQLLATLDISSHWYQMYRFVEMGRLVYVEAEAGPEHRGLYLESRDSLKRCTSALPNSSLLKGKTSHKLIDLSESPLLRWYYWKVGQWKLRPRGGGSTYVP
jgi:hypothetical protein